MEQLIGCGKSRERRISLPESPEGWTELVTLDIEPSAEPDVLHDLNVLPYPFKDGQFDEIHAYDVLEHCGRQGDYKFFFAQFDEFHRILKPGGLFIGITPMWDCAWAWADPGHTRVICKESLIFLNRDEYQQCGTTAMTDYRDVYRGDFEIQAVREEGNRRGFVLRARK